MKKIKKNLLPFLKRFAALMSVVMVLISSFTIPSFASGTASTSSSPSYYSYWNLSKLICTYSDGVVAIFDMPTTFFETNSYYNENITLTSNNGRTLELRTYVGTTQIDKPSVAFLFDVRSFSNIQFVFQDSVVRYYPLNSSTSTMPPGYSVIEEVPLIQFSSDTNVVSSFSGSYTSVRPVRGSSDDTFTFKFDYFSGNFGLEQKSDSQFNLYYLIANSSYQSELDYYRDYEINTRFHVPYFQNINVDLDFDWYGFSSETYTVGLSFPLGRTYNGYSFNPVSEWYQLFFTGYKQFGDGANIDFTSWLSTAVGGFLAFEIMPGISLGLLLTFIIGVAAVNFFLKFFAGG